MPPTSSCARLRAGVELDDGLTEPARVRVVQPRPGEERARDHDPRRAEAQVRRMCAAVGHPVSRLVRTRIGPLTDTRLAPGSWRHLRLSEVRALYEAAHSSPGREHTSH